MKSNEYYLKLEDSGYYTTIDKRSKDYREYKEWRARHSDYNILKEGIESAPKGLGDTVAKITKAIGLDKVVKFIAGEDCGCDERKDKLNSSFKYKNIKCLTEDDYNYLRDFFKKNSGRITFEEKFRVITIYNYVFNAREKTNSSCPPCIIKIVRELKVYMSTY